MHELSIAMALVEQLDQEARKRGAARVLSADIRVGALCGVDPEALEFAFGIAAERTLAEGAALRTERTPARGNCRACGRETPLEFPLPRCEHCGATAVTVTGGKELLLASMEVEMGETDNV